MADFVVTASDYAQVSASGNVYSGQSYLTGIFVSAASGTPTITVFDDAAIGTSATLISVFTPVAGTFYQMPFKVKTGINIVIGGTVQATVGYNRGFPFRQGV